VREDDRVGRLPASEQPEQRGWLAPLAAAAFASALALLLWSPSAVGVFFDDGIYVLLGKALAAGDGLRYTGVAGAPPAPKYPPLYPLALAAVWKISPSFPASVPYLKAVGVGFAIIAAGLFAWYVQRALRFPAWFALLTAAGAWATVEVWRYAVVPLSEPLFLLTLILCLAAAARVEQRPDSKTATILLLAAFAAAYYTRTIAVIVPVAAVITQLLQRRWRTAVWIALGSGFVMLPWMVWTRAAADRISPHLADVLGGYGMHLASQVSMDPAGYVVGLAGRAVEIARRMLEAVLPAVPVAVQLAATPVLVVLGGFGVARLWRRSPTTVLAVLAYFGVLVLWPFVSRRLLAPIAPWLVLAVAAGCYDLYERARQRPGARKAVAVLSTCWALAFAIANAAALLAREHDRLHLSRSVRLLSAAQAVSQTVPSGGVVAAPELWAGLHLYTGRTVAPSVRFRPIGTGEAQWGTPAEQLALWQSVGAGYVLLEFGPAVNGDALQLIQQRCGNTAVQLVARAEGMDLVRLALDDACRARLTMSP
jgi:hypothetical protein